MTLAHRYGNRLRRARMPRTKVDAVMSVVDPLTATLQDDWQCRATREAAPSVIFAAPRVAAMHRLGASELKCAARPVTLENPVQGTALHVHWSAGKGG